MSPQKQTNTRYGLMSYYHEDPTIGHSLNLYGEYCHPEIEMILSLVNKDSTYIDIGANIGTHTVSIAPHVQQVYAFEPDPNNYQLLLSNTSGHNNITVINNAISDDECSGYTDFNFGRTIFVESNGSCLTSTIDSYNIEKIDFVKIDTEGFELRILQGMTNVLTYQQPNMLIEMQDIDTYRAIYDYLKTFNYYMYWMPVATFNPNNFKKESKDVFGPRHGVINWICSIKQLNTTLQPVVDRDDTVERMNWRIRNNVGHDTEHGE